MATKIVQPKVKTASGFDDLVIQQAQNATNATNATNANNAVNATNATYAQYASIDTSKGTIEERLTRLGFKEGVIDLNSIAPATSTNYVHRQGNYVTGQLAWSTYFVLQSGDTVVGTIPENFRPTSTADICYFGAGDDYYYFVTIGTDGKITVTSSTTALFGTLTFGYEAPALT